MPSHWHVDFVGIHSLLDAAGAKISGTKIHFSLFPGKLNPSTRETNEQINAIDRVWNPSFLSLSLSLSFSLFLSLECRQQNAEKLWINTRRIYRRRTKCEHHILFLIWEILMKSSEIFVVSKLFALFTYIFFLRSFGKCK